MKGSIFFRICTVLCSLLFAISSPCHAEMRTIQKSTPASQPVKTPIPAKTTPKRAVPHKTVPAAVHPAPVRKAIVDSVSLQEKGKGAVRIKDTIRLKQGKTATLTVTGKNLELIDKIDVAGGKRGGVTVKVISSSKTMKKISLTAHEGGTYQVKLRAGVSVVKTVSVKIDAPEKVYRTAKKPAVPVPSTKPEVKKPPVKKAKPAPAKKAPDQKKKTRVATKTKPQPEAKRKTAPTAQPAKPAKRKEIAVSAKKPAKPVAKKPAGDKVLKRAEKTVPAPPKKRSAAGPPPKKVAATKPVAKPAKPKGKSAVAKKPDKGSVAIDTVPLPERPAAKPKLGKVTSKSTPLKEKPIRPSPAKTSVTDSKMAKKPTLKSKRPVIRSISTRTLRLEPGKTQTVTLLGTDLDKITAVQVLSNNRSISNVVATLGPSSGTSRSITLTASPNADPGNYQIKIFAGSKTDIDINAYVQAVLREVYVLQTEAIKDHAEKVKTYNEAKKKVRVRTKDAREWRAGGLNATEQPAYDFSADQLLSSFMKLEVQDPATTSSAQTSDNCAALQEKLISLQQEKENITFVLNTLQPPSPPPPGDWIEYQEELRIYETLKEKLEAQLAQLQSSIGNTQTELDACDSQIEERIGTGSLISAEGSATADERIGAGSLIPAAGPATTARGFGTDSLVSAEGPVTTDERIGTGSLISAEGSAATVACAGLEEEKILAQQGIEAIARQIEIEKGKPHPPTPRREDYSSEIEYLKALQEHVRLDNINDYQINYLLSRLAYYQNKLTEVEAQLESCRDPYGRNKAEPVYDPDLAQPAVKSQMNSRQFTAISNIMKTKQDTENASINNIRGDDSDTSQSDQSQEQGEESPGASNGSEPAKIISKATDTKTVKIQNLEKTGNSQRLPEAASSDTDTTDIITAQKWQEEQSEGALMYHAISEMAKTGNVASKMDKVSSAQIQERANLSSGASEESGNDSETSEEGIYIGANIYDGRRVLVEATEEPSDENRFEVESRAGESALTNPNVHQYSSTEDYLASLRTGITLTIWNRSLIELLEVRVHDTTDYQNAPNQLQSPLPDEGQIGVPFESGQYVTVIRRRVEGGETIAFTTGVGLNVPENGYILQVFQESFRLLPPEDN